MSKLVMVVEDCPYQRKALNRLLNLYSFEVILAENGEQALDFYRKNSSEIKLIFIDNKMRWANEGIATTRVIRNLEKELGNGTIPIIGITGDPDSHYLNLAEKVGITQTIPKPFQFDQISEAMNKYNLL